MRERTLTPKRHERGCRREHLFPRPVHARGLCVSCYNRYAELVRAKRTDWAELERLELVSPKAMTVEDELNLARQAAKKQSA